MIFHRFGTDGSPALLLIHGALTPWQIWQPMIDAFKDSFRGIVPALDGHTEEAPSEFISFKALPRYGGQML